MTDTFTRILRAAGAALLGSLASSTRESSRTGATPARRRGAAGAAGTRTGTGARSDASSGQVREPRPRPPSPQGTPPPRGRSDVREVPVSEALAHAGYDPSPDGDADPGEVVWTWVPYQEDPTVGKDRPVVVLGRSGQGVHVAQMTSKDHDRDAAQEARNGRYWVDIGTGPWDSRGRPSEVRLDRTLWVPSSEVRREGAVLPRTTFETVLAGLRSVEDSRHRSGDRSP